MLILHFKMAQEKPAASMSAVFALGCGFLLVGAQIIYAVGSPVSISCDSGVNKMTSAIAIPGVQKPSAIQELCFARISGDWRDTFSWMRGNLDENNRMLSWWDYGHWTTFWGEAKTVLDPGNGYPEYDQETAHALVNGSTKELVRVFLFESVMHPINYLASC